MSDKQKVLVIVGATASGKTGLAVELAKQFDGEVISADSRQVYRKLNIGTAKVTKEEMQGVPHHFIDVVDISDVYTAADFVRDGRAAIADITARGKLPIIAGGTFFYVDLLLGRLSMPEVAPNPTLRGKLEKMSTEDLHAELRERDSARAATIDPNNKRRLIRALEIVAAIGHVPAIPTEELYDTLWLGTERSKDDLRERITKRANSWLHGGFKDEVAWLLAQDCTPERLAEFGFEYTIGAAWVQGELTNEQFVEQFLAKNWQYAKRQLTWLQKNDEVNWLQPDTVGAAQKLVTNWLED
ncbi:tRNA (adenosine(37)-N6)-dimethylallyltransferase MiaA [bacterium]|nr:tRNA (adenosine(37)-N6)-dimethylallyltransferase MiaA [bacterium]|tara:strand:- start:381 stop:1277 length:897 start_codon:yes stop_codon:yes gene_type:complete